MAKNDLAVIGKSDVGNVTLNPHSLVTSRLLVTANSGGGKSYLLRKLIEQIGKTAQTFVLDLEGEFASLREQLDLVIVGPGGEVPADVRSAGLLVRRLMEKGISAVIDLSELKFHQRRTFVRVFLEALMELPKSLWHPLFVVIDEAHQFCLSDDTEILTADGWKPYTYLTAGMPVVAFDPANGDYQYEEIERVITLPHDGPMVHIESDGIDCLMTDDHRALIRRTQRAKGRYGRVYDWSFCPAKDLPTHFYVPIGGGPAMHGLSLSDDLLRILGWVITDGSKNSDGRYITISQAKSTVKNGTAVAEVMADVLQRCGRVSIYDRPARESARKDGRVVKGGKAVEFYLGKELSKQVFGWLGKDIHRIHRRLFDGCSRRQLEQLLLGLMEGNGTVDNRSSQWVTFYAGLNEGLADDVNELATRLGMSCVKRYVPQNKQWKVTFSKREHHYIRKAKRQHFTGQVWCVTVKSGAFVARRNGKVFVTGNCPEKGHGEAESLQAVRDLCTLGRKRGYCAILATQRISTLDKSCAGECNNKFIGRMTLDLDVKRAAFELGVSPAEALKMLRDLDRGEFYAFGPAIDPSGITRLTVGKVLTTHPKAGQGQTLTPPKPSAAITSILGELADLPKQAEAEIKDMAAAKAKIAELNRQLAAKPAPAAAVEKVVEKPVITDMQIERLEKLQETIAKRVDAWWTRAADGVNPLIELLKAQSRETATLLATAQAIRKVPTIAAALPMHTSRVVIETRRPAAPPRPATTAARPSDGSITPAMQKILDSLAWWEVIGQPAPERGAAAVMAGYTVNGHFNNLCGALRTAGLIDYPAGGTLALTDAGQGVATFPGAPGTLAEVHNAWKKKLDNAQWKLVDVVIRSHPNAMEKENLAAAAGYTVNGHFNNLLGSLRSLGVIHKRSPIAATTLLFPEGLA